MQDVYETDGAASGQAEIHLGWLDGRICFGAGPAVIRMSVTEAREARRRLAELLRLGPDEGSQCGCPSRVR